MQQTEIIMGMPITIKLASENSKLLIRSCFDYFRKVDAQYSTYKSASEISQINDGLPKAQWSGEMKEVFRLCDETKKLTSGYFNIEHDGTLDPSGLVKGWAINSAANHLLEQGVSDFYVEAGGDIQVHGKDGKESWTVGIRNPFNIHEIIKKISVSDEGVATSGTYVRGQHIYDPHHPKAELTEVKSLTVIAKNIFEADRFATAAFAMGVNGIEFIKQTVGFEGYMVTADGMATYTNGFERYVVNA
jgi:FAD:protein FMN transferase